MANRVIRDWTASENVDELSVKAEVFFTRLIMKADDFGNYVSNPKLLCAALFPLKQYDVGSIEAWINECVVNGLVRRYEVDGKKYLHIPNFDQKLRRMKNTYPPPPVQTLPSTADKSRTSDGQVTAETKGNESETEVETESESESARIDPRWLLEETLKNGLDEIYLDGQKPKWVHINFDFELNTFKEKVRGSPDDYAQHDVNGIRKAFQYQLRFAKPKKNGNGFTDKRQQQTDSLIEGFTKRALDGDDGR